MKSNPDTKEEPNLADIGTTLLIESIEKLIYCAEKRELEIIYQFSKEVVSAK